MKKKFIITVDTEPDGQWDIKAKETTKNAKYIPRFQALCDAYGFKPVYLTDYVMADDPEFAKMIKRFVANNSCEIGMHLHAWDTPPFVPLDKMVGSRPYLIEYSVEEMEEKICKITEKLTSTFETEIISHRAGRWATNFAYLKILEKYGYKIDCSFTPHINWENVRGRSPNSKGSNYKRANESVHRIEHTSLIEVPMTIRKIGRIDSIRNCRTKSFKSLTRNILKGENYWFRPALFSIEQMKQLFYLTKEDEYIEMMIHSSELMPGGSPYFKDESSIENMYSTIEALFELVSNTHEGATLEEFVKQSSVWGR